ncbi:MAG: homoserine O-acetyltransferase [Phycisphaeraceae bacterium]|nr:homoserine O-acetyltransferase [Phycisphaeraceae bacterium]
MTSSDSFSSSDTVRSATPLRHVRTAQWQGPIRLRRGGALPDVQLAYETWGTLNNQRDNAVLICHALSGDSHAARHDADDQPGWWDILIGPGKPVDTDRWFVICSNVLGGCRGTTGPGSTNPRTGQPYGPDFPLITIEDMVDAQARLMDHLGIDRLKAVIGGSLGGHQAIAWALHYPQRIEQCMGIATGAYLSSQAMAFDVVGRNAIMRDPSFHGGQYYQTPDKPDVGLALARMLAHITYLSPQSMAVKFDPDRHQPRDIPTEFEKKFSVGSYLAYQGDRFVERFDANSYITLSMAMDLFDLGRAPEQLARSLAPAVCRWLLISFTSDWLFPASQSREMVDALIKLDRQVTYCNVQSPSGHDAFLLEDSLCSYGELVRCSLERSPVRAEADRSSIAPEAGGSDVGEPKLRPVLRPPVSDDQRLDIELTASLVEPGSSVLDLGCGPGELLQALAQRGHRRLLGVELGEDLILGCAARGIDVIQTDLNEGLSLFKDKQFDYAILSQTLQSIVNTESITDELLRVGRKGIVSFPNFAYHRIRDMLYHEGRSPSTSGLLSFDWFNTPNRRFFSVLDWREFCRRRGIRIHRELFLDTEAGRFIEDDPNLLADLAICVISR